MSEPDAQPTHAEILFELVRSRTSALGDKTWTMNELVKHSGLRPHQVSNAIARIRREADGVGETPLLRVKTGARGQYVYEGPLKRGRKPKDTVHAATPTEEVPFTDDELADNTLLDMNTQLASEDETVVIVDPASTSPTGRLGPERQPPLQNVKPQPTIAQGFAQIGEKISAAMGDIREAMGVIPASSEAVQSAIETEKAAGREKAVRNNKVARIRRLMNELAQEMRYLENEWDALVEKGRRYDKMTMTMFGFSSNDPYAVDREMTKP